MTSWAIRIREIGMADFTSPRFRMKKNHIHVQGGSLPSPIDSMLQNFGVKHDLPRLRAWHGFQTSPAGGQGRSQNRQC
jgi:hypothetical protein